MRRRDLLATLGATGLVSGCQAPVSLGRQTAFPTRQVAVRDVMEPAFRGAMDGPFTGSVTVLDESIDADSTAKLELTLTNVGDDSVRISRYNVGYALKLYHSSTGDATVILRNGEADRRFTDPPCWQLTETFPPDGVYSMRLGSGETVRSVRYVHGSPGNESPCIPPDGYRFERYRPEWSFTLAVEET